MWSSFVGVPTSGSSQNRHVTITCRHCLITLTNHPMITGSVALSSASSLIPLFYLQASCPSVGGPQLLAFHVPSIRPIPSDLRRRCLGDCETEGTKTVMWMTTLWWLCLYDGIEGLSSHFDLCIRDFLVLGRAGLWLGLVPVTVLVFHIYFTSSRPRPVNIKYNVLIFRSQAVCITFQIATYISATRNGALWVQYKFIAK